MLIVQQKSLYNEIWLVLGYLIRIPCKYSADLRKITALLVYVWPWVLEKGLVLPITFIPKCLPNKVLMKPTVTLISEIISVIFFRLLSLEWSLCCIFSCDAFLPAEYARSLNVSNFVVLLYFRNVDHFVTVLHSQSWFVFKVIVSNLENFPALKREMVITEMKQFYGSSGVSALLFSPLSYCFYSVASVTLQVEAA